MTSRKPRTISVSDSVKVKDDLNTWKRWFNGIKHFFTVKSLPPRR